MRHIPNLLSISRILGSLCLVLLEPLSLLFFSVYLACGLSDILDGYIARRNKSSSQLGATLDSIADTVFVFILLIIFVPLLEWSSWMLYWIFLIACMRLLSLVIGFAKYHSLAFLHTYANKLTGLVLFCFPILCSVLDLSLTVCLICSIATLSALEEVLININSKELSRDVRSIFI